MAVTAFWASSSTAGKCPWCGHWVPHGTRARTNGSEVLHAACFERRRAYDEAQGKFGPVTDEEALRRITRKKTP